MKPGLFASPAVVLLPAYISITVLILYPLLWLVLLGVALGTLAALVVSDRLRQLEPAAAGARDLRQPASTSSPRVAPGTAAAGVAQVRLGAVAAYQPPAADRNALTRNFPR